MNKNLILITLFSFAMIVFHGEPTLYGIDPFSKIVVTSTHALCRPDQVEKKNFIFKYQDNVKVVFADNSQITSNNLEIIFDSSTFNEVAGKKNKSKTGSVATQKKSSTLETQQFKKSDNLVSQFKKIIFEGNVRIKRASQTISTDKAELYLNNRVCKLTGNVVVKQLKAKPKDIPLEMKSNQALFDLKTEKISFLGNSASPVSTTIDLVGLINVQKKDKRHKKS